ncbi:MAG: sodium-dependent transporter [Methanosphaera sp. rholeuAM6]|nr:MAG: sodium-dependent transporter [Methanosphaera sp. rholeuAM6]
MTDNKKRVKWDSNLSFLLAMIGSAVGLGNIWRFPYVAYTNGGGAFLIPYIISILFMGIPLLFVEYGAGFKFKSGISRITHKINPKYEYLGWFIQMSPFLILSYYVCVVAWDLMYVPVSFFKGWGTNPEQFFNTVLLQNNVHISGLLHISIYVLISMLIIWAIIWFISHRNLNDGIGKANRILTPMLFIMMIIIVLFALTLPGASIGLATLFTPDWNAIFNPNIWSAAFGQILFSLSIGMTITLAYASYLPDDVNIPKSALTVAIANSSFEVFTAVGVFSILGFMSLTNNIPIGQLVSQGTGLAFIVFPQIFNVMGTVGYVIGPLFFLCLLFAGITSNISIIEPLSLSLQDKFSTSRSKAVSIVCAFAFVISLLFSTSYGSTLLGIFDTFTNQFGLLLNVVIQTTLLAIIYGLDNLLPGLNKNATFLKLGKKWMLLVSYFIPLITLLLWIDGVSRNVIFVDTTTMIIELILLMIMIILPIILTKIPSKNDDF